MHEGAAVMDCRTLFYEQITTLLQKSLVVSENNCNFAPHY